MKKLLVLVALVSLGACGGGDDAPVKVSDATTTSAGPNDEVSDGNTTSAAPDAAAVAAGLRAAKLPVGTVKVYSAADDPNNLLGRPGGYTSKVNFHDTRLPAPVEPGPCDPLQPGQDEPVCHNKPKDPDINDGGSIEVFDNEADAKKRFDYVDAITRGGGPFTEYHWLVGKTFIRVSASLTPEQAKPYEAAAKKILGE